MIYKKPESIRIKIVNEWPEKPLDYVWMVIFTSAKAAYIAFTTLCFMFTLLFVELLESGASHEKAISIALLVFP